MPSLSIQKCLDYLGRACLAAIFIIAIPVKITNFSNVVSSIVSRGIPEPIALVLLLLAIVLLIIGTILLIFSNNQKIGASLLIIFLVPTTIIFHIVPFQTQAVFVNLGLIGGLIIAMTRPELKEGEW